MIYRILIDGYESEWDEDTGKMRYSVGLCGIATGFGGMMDYLGLDAPEIHNTRARFYFTERGWDKVGRALAAEATKAGHTVKVIRRKNPLRSQIVFRDAYQLAILPLRQRHD